jgi:hypothetical protein
MRNVMRKTLVTVGIAAALAVGPGVGMANAAPTQLVPPGLIPEGGLVPQGLIPEGLIPHGLIPLPALGL